MKHWRSIISASAQFLVIGKELVLSIIEFICGIVSGYSQMTLTPII